MKKYFYFNTNQDHWFSIAKKLYEDKIAEPVLWLGDDIHYNNAFNLFGKNVVKSQNFVHRPYEFKNIEYSGAYQDFFFSNNYLRAKDRCLKMMDRLDLYGTFNRLDREIYFQNITIWILEKIKETKPDVLITAEAPHDHAKYLILEICKFLKIPAYKFQNWMPAPLMYLQNIFSQEIIPIGENRDNLIDKEVEKDIIDYISEVKNNSYRYEPFYMRAQRKNEKLISRILNFFKKDLRLIFLDIRHNTGRLILKKYNPINPTYSVYVFRYFKNLLRRRNLNNSAYKAITEINLEKKFVYFPLHFEPERTTNPDGNNFHDQFITLTKIREFIDADVDIIIKEHPTQLRSYFKRGIWGRSPLFYRLVKNIKGVQIANPNYSSLELIKKSQVVFSITGTVALESAILGKKAVTFGSTYFDGCPNIFKWDKYLSYNEIISSQIYSDKSVQDFLISKKRKYCSVGFQNGSQRNFFKKYQTKKFDQYQYESLYLLLKKFFTRDLLLDKVNVTSKSTNKNSSWVNLKRPYLIAEIGGNHEGDFNKAEEILNLAIESGADCVKFQIYSADSLVSKIESPERYKHFKKFELTKEEHIHLAKICNSKGIKYTSSVWSLESVEWIDPYVDFYKIGSGDLTAYPIIKSIVNKGKPIILSTGLSNIDEVLKTVKFIQDIDYRYRNPEMLCLLQCTSMYPINSKDVNLNVMNQFKDLTNLSVGYSDHTEGLEALKIAASMGANVLEFHFTDTRENQTFRDHKVSLTKQEVISFRRFLDELSLLKGEGEKKLLKIESDNNHEHSFRRGVYLNKELNKGSFIKEGDLICLRPAKGTDATMFYNLIGSRVLKKIKPFTAINNDIDYKIVKNEK